MAKFEKKIGKKSRILENWGLQNWSIMQLGSDELLERHGKGVLTDGHTRTDLSGQWPPPLKMGSSMGILYSVLFSHEQQPLQPQEHFSDEAATPH